MSAIGLVLLFVGGITVVFTSIWLLVKAFQTSVLWGLGSLLVPFVGLIFVILFWQDAKKPFLYQLGGAVLLFVGMALSGQSLPTTAG